MMTEIKLPKRWYVLNYCDSNRNNEANPVARNFSPKPKKSKIKHIGLYIWKNQENIFYLKIKNVTVNLTGQHYFGQSESTIYTNNPLPY